MSQKQLLNFTISIVLILPRILGISRKEKVWGWMIQEDMCSGEFTSGQESARIVSGCMIVSQESAFMKIKVRKGSELSSPQYHSKLCFSPSRGLATNCFCFLHFSPGTMNNKNSKQSKLCMVQISSVFWSCLILPSNYHGGRGFLTDEVKTSNPLYFPQVFPFGLW